MVFKNDDERMMAAIVAKHYFEEGKTTREIAKGMCLSESKVRELKNIIDDAEKNNKSLWELWEES